MRRLLKTALAVVVGVDVLGAAWLIGRIGDDGSGGAAEAAATTVSAGTTTAKVTKRDLAETQDVSGTLGYGETRDVSFGGHGTITALPAVGTVVDRGAQLGEVDGHRVTVLLGDRPVWRDLAPGVSDGFDVGQLEANLIALGHGTAGALGTNNTWSEATTDAVKRWQRATGQAETGAVRMGEVVFLPAAVRIADRPGLSGGGGGGGGAALKVTGTVRQVDIDVDASYQSLVKVDQVVTVELPDGSEAEAKITSVGAVAQAQEGGDPTIPVVATLNDPAAGAGLDQAPVTVRFVISQATGVLAVPVGALLALTEGGYALERVTGAGTTALVGVELGTFADGWVEVTGDVKEGDTVVVAE